MVVTKNSIIQILEKGLKGNTAVYAFWLEGSEASGRADKHSDLDIWLDVKDGRENAIARESIALLQTLSPVDFLNESKPHPKIRHHAIHLLGMPKTLTIDLCIQSHSRKYVFKEGVPDDKIKVVFNKKRTIKYRKLNKTRLHIEIEKRIEHLSKTYDFFFNAYYYKHVIRGNFIDAFYYYQNYVIEPIIDLFKIKYSPGERGSLCWKHISDVLPGKVVKTIEYYYKINSVKEMEAKSQEAKRLCHRLIKEMNVRNR